MTGDLLNEWRAVRRHPMIWTGIFATLLFSAAAVRGAPTDPEEGGEAVLLWLHILFPMFMLPFLAGALAPIFYLRETDHAMDEIVGSYPLTPRRWLVVRVASLTLLMLLACLLSQILVVVLLAIDFPGEGGTLPMLALKWLVILQLPNCLLWASLLAWVSVRQAHSGMIYFSAAMIWLGYNALAAITGSWMIAGSIVLWEPLQQAMFLLDPYAGMSLMGAVPESGLLSSRDLNLAAGRILWLAIAFLLLRAIKTVPMLAGRRTGKTDRRETSVHSGQSSHIGIHLRYVARDKVFPLLVLGWLALSLPDVIGGMDWVEPFSKVDADSRDALNRIIWDVVIGAGTMVLLYISDRICRLYPGTRMHELYAATPHQPARLIGVQLMSVWLVGLFFVALAGLAVAAAQLIRQSPIQPLEYAAQLGLAFSRLALFGSLYVAMHALVRQRFLANLGNLLIIVLSFSPLLSQIELRHPLWRPAGTPLAAPDHYWNFGGGDAGHWQYTAFWAAIGLALLLIAVARHHRTMPFAQKRLTATMGHPATILAALTLGLATMQGIAIDWTLRAEGALLSPHERHSWRAAFERDYLHWANRAQPDVEAINARVDFRPSKQRVRLRADLILINRTGEAISEVLVGRNQHHIAGTVLTMENATIRRRDPNAGQTVFALDTPLAPGERTALTVEFSLAQSNLTSPAFPLVLRPSFNSLPAYALLPFVGFQQDVILRAPENRKRQGLPPLKVPLPSQLGADASRPIARDRVMLDTIVTTEAGHQAIAQGQLVRRWQEDGRSAFHYRTEKPIRGLPAFFSVPWQPQHWSAGSVNLQSYTPEPIAANDANLLGLQDAISFLGTEVAPYPATNLSLLAVPDIGFTGYALPQIIQVAHKVAFRAHPAKDAGFNQIYRRAAHEAAHQWFGHMLGFGVADERSFLIESLAKYAELVLVERRYGRKAMAALVAYERDRYRDAVRDPLLPVAPLIDADQNYDQYSRATLVFACLRRHIGDEPIIAALREAVETGRASNRPWTSLKVANAIIRNSESPSRQPVARLLLGSEPVGKLLQDLHCVERQGSVH